MTSAQRVANVTSIQQTANELNTAMGQLQHGIDDENTTKQTQKYRDAEQSKKLLMIKLWLQRKQF